MYVSAPTADLPGLTLPYRRGFAEKDCNLMNRDRLHGIWQQLTGMLLHRWGTLTDDPRTADAGARALRSGRNLARRGRAKQEAKRQLDHILKHLRYLSALSVRR
jgi:uncharacterized protein YjbJ (UPF0337 family)